MSISKRKNYGVRELRKKVSVVFALIAEIYKIHYSKGVVSFNFENCFKYAIKMHDEGKLSDELFAEAEEVYKWHLTLMPAMVEVNFEYDEAKARERINKYAAILFMAESDFALELHRLIEKERDYLVELNKNNNWE